MTSLVFSDYKIDVFICLLFALHPCSCSSTESTTRRQSSEQNTRKSLSVKVGSMKCMVESQYISNH